MKQSAIAQAPIQYFPLDRLYVSPMNPRSVSASDDDGLELLAQSIKIAGLIQNLAGLLDDDGKVGIVAGGRRLRAMSKLTPEEMAEAGLAEIPVRIAPDEATARAWASAENSAREDLHPADEIRAYGRMHAAGSDAPTIAQIFGTTEKQVYRRLALANLPAPVLDALKAGKISLGIAAAFTVSNDEAHALTVLQQVIDSGHSPSEHRVKTMLQPEAISLSDRRAQFVGLDAYQAEGGKITRDLFEDSVYLQDADLLDRLFAEKLSEAGEAIQTEGRWKWISVEEGGYIPYSTTEKMQRLYPVEGELNEEQADRYDELAELMEAEAIDEDGIAELAALEAGLKGDYTDEQRAQGGVYVYVGSSGEVRTEGVYVRPEDQAAAIEAGVLTGHAARCKGDDAPKSPYSAALADDMRRARLHAVQAALLAKPELVLDLLAFTLSGRGGEYETVLGIKKDRANILPEKPEGLAADPRLEDQRASGSGWMDGEKQVAAFEQFQGEGKKARNAVLTLELARTLALPDRKRDLFAKIEALAGADLRQVWTPTAEGFFSRVSAPYLESLFLDLTGCGEDSTGFKAWKALKKAEKAASMERLFTEPDYQAVWQIDAEKKARIEAWKPGCI